MKEIKLVGLDQNIYFEKLDNGLEVYLIPFDNKQNYAMHYITKFGSVQTSFIPYGKKDKIRVPDGIAHFLEHQMFEQEDGVDPFTFASKTGTYSNASTNFDCTRYYFEGNKAFIENLNYLLDFVGSPYFTDESVEQEKGIIAEEIKQYDDEVDWVFEEKLKKALLKNDNHRVDIGGTVESIYKITKEDLYDTYYTFYQPSNMFLIISGNFDKDLALDTIKNNETLKNAKSNFNIKVFNEKEIDEVYKKSVDIKFHITNPKVGYGIKIPTKKIEDKYLFSLYISVMLNVKFGLSSLFREKIKNDKLATNFCIEKDIIDDYILIDFKMDSDKKDEIINIIKNELLDINISEEDIERVKKVWVASEVIASDNINELLESIVSDIIEYKKIVPNKIDIIKSLNKKDYDNFLKNVDFQNASIVVINPKD